MAQMVPLDNSLIDLASLRYCLPEELLDTASTSDRTALTAASVKVLSAPSSGASSNKILSALSYCRLSVFALSSSFPPPHTPFHAIANSPLHPSHPLPSLPLPSPSLSAPPIPFPLCPSHPLPSLPLPSPSLSAPPIPFPLCPSHPLPSLPLPSPSPYPSHTPPAMLLAHASQRLVDALDSVPGGKALVLDASISGPLAFIAPISLLKVAQS
ncbi:unnamed protein product [Closterium sp. NIES-64]|nr:unnamed protein product [Closterium sp. NIES-64]